jgi:hypothetical protein
MRTKARLRRVDAHDCLGECRILSQTLKSVNAELAALARPSLLRIHSAQDNLNLELEIEGEKLRQAVGLRRSWGGFTLGVAQG